MNSGSVNLAYISESRFPAPLRGPARTEVRSRHNLLRPPVSESMPPDFGPSRKDTDVK